MTQSSPQIRRTRSTLCPVKEETSKPHNIHYCLLDTNTALLIVQNQLLFCRLVFLQGSYALSVVVFGLLCESSTKTKKIWLFFLTGIHFAIFIQYYIWMTHYNTYSMLHVVVDWINQIKNNNKANQCHTDIVLNQIMWAIITHSLSFCSLQTPNVVMA